MYSVIAIAVHFIAGIILAQYCLTKIDAIEYYMKYLRTNLEGKL